MTDWRAEPHDSEHDADASNGVGALPRWIDYVPVDDLQDALTNAKGHADETIDASIQRFRFAGVPLVDERTGRIVGGHGRRDSLRRLKASGAEAPEGILVGEDGSWLVPVERGWASKDDDEAEALGIALNRTTEIGGWQDAQLVESLTKFAEMPDGLAGLGFDQDDLDRLVAAANTPPEPDPEPDDVPDAPTDPVTQPGDMWFLGDHLILCGDCRNPEHVARLIGDHRVNLAFTSPPLASRQQIHRFDR